MTLLGNRITDNQRYQLILWFIVLNLLDVLTTMIAVWFLDARELNFLINYMPLWVLMIVKMILILFVSYCLLYQKIPLWVHKLMCWLMIFVVVWNTLNIVLDLLL